VLVNLAVTDHRHHVYLAINKWGQRSKFKSEVRDYSATLALAKTGVNLTVNGDGVWWQSWVNDVTRCNGVQWRRLCPFSISPHRRDVSTSRCVVGHWNIHLQVVHPFVHFTQQRPWDSVTKVVLSTENYHTRFIDVHQTAPLIVGYTALLAQWSGFGPHLARNVTLWFLIADLFWVLPR